jgi:putative transposase
MPWKERSVMDEKLRFAVRSLEKNINFSRLCKEFGISTKTGYKIKARFLAGGIPELEDRPRKPLSNSKEISNEWIFEIIKIKKAKPYWGAPKIHATLVDMYSDRNVPSESTVSRILKKSGYVKKKKRRRINRTERITHPVEAERPNHIWTVDFKGWWYTPTREKCEPLTVRDHYSKFCFSIKILKKGDISNVKAEFMRLFREYGLPEVIRSDNGPPFANVRAVFGLTKLSVWWLSLGIKLDRIAPGKPQQNGSHERMHLDMYNELEGKINGDLKMHQSIFEVWRNEYNTERPHEALGMKKPAQVYEKSKRKYREADLIKYPQGVLSRLVNNRGNMFYKGRRIFISNAFNGFNVGLDDRPRECMKVWFANHFLGEIDKKSFVFTPNKELITVVKVD